MKTQHSILSNVKLWLEDGRIDADTIADVPWVVEMHEEENRLTAVNPVFPVRLLLFYDPDAEVIRLVVETGIRTVDLPPEDKLSLYRKALNLAKVPLVKLYLFGDDDELAVAADLSAKTLGEQEFNDTLAFLLSLLNHLYNVVGIPEEKKLEEMINLAWLVKKWIEKGWSRERLEQLFVRAGLSAQEVKELIDTITQSEGEDGGRKQGPTIYT